MIEVRDSSTSATERDDSPHTYQRHHRRTGSGQHTPPTCVGTHSVYDRRRSSAFFEVGLGGDDLIVDAKIRRNSRPRQQVRFRSKVEVHESNLAQRPTEDFACLGKQPQSFAISAFFPTLPRLMFLACIFLLGLQSWNDVGFFKAGISPIGAKAGPIKVRDERSVASLPAQQDKRQDSTTICVRWSGQSAVVNGTLFYYGGRSTQSSGQTSDTWSRSEQPLLKSKILIISRQRLHLPRPHQNMGYHNPVTRKPGSAIRSTSSCQWLPLELI